MVVRSPNNDLPAAFRAMVNDLRKAPDLRAAAALLRASAEIAGLTHVAVIMDASHPDAPTDEHGESLVELLGWKRAFIDAWLQRKGAARSPNVAATRLEHLPFVWHGTTSSKNRTQINDLLGLGITAGVIAPVRLPRGRFALVSWMGPITETQASDLLERAGPEFLLLGHYFLELVRERSDPLPMAEGLAYLTERELECLTLVAKGASDNEASTILGLTARTIRFHFQNAAAKLGARSRSHAVALATQLGILGPII